MAATVRIARVAAATAAAVSAAQGGSAGGSTNGAAVRIAGITTQTGASAATVRIADITARAGGSAATVRIADVQAFSISNAYLWNGSAWVLGAPVGTALSTATARSAGTGSVPDTGQGRGRGVSAATGAVDAPTLTATALPDDTPPRILLTVYAPAATQVTITRINADGARSTVRDANPKMLVGGVAPVYDYEAPFGQPVTYTATTDATASLATAPVTLAVTQPWLLHPGIPNLSQPVTVRTIGDQTSDTLQGVHYVLGRDKPVVISDGVRHASTFDLTLKTSTQADGLMLEGLLSDASPLLLQAAYPYTGETFYGWVSIGGVTRSPYNRFIHPGVVWTLSCTEVDRPAGLLQTQRTLADVAAQFLTLAEVRDTYARLLDVYIDTPISG
jgi:hypothetical protein